MNAKDKYYNIIMQIKYLAIPKICTWIKTDIVHYSKRKLKHRLIEKSTVQIRGLTI